MYFIKVIFQVLIVLILGACAAQGPIKVYDERTKPDLSNINIIYLPPEIELLEADGMVFETPYIETGFNEVHLLPGHHEIALKYAKFWGDPSSGRMITTKPVVFSIDLTNKSKYFVRYDKPEDIWGAQALIQKFSPWIEDDKGVKLKVSATQLGTASLTNINKSVTARQFVEGNNSLEKLKFWWKNSTGGEKAAFKKWIEDPSVD